jgi:O-antigen/teichoic acid export membrane protein
VSRQRRFAFARLLSSAVVSQALLSAASFVIGLILIRGATDVQYGYYILASGATLLLASLQNAFFGPPLAIRMSRLDRSERSDLVGGLYREQRRFLPIAGGVAIVVTLVLWYANVLDVHTGPLVFVTVLAALAILFREYFRIVLLAHRRAYDVLRADIFYVALLVAGIFVAILTPTPAMVAIVTLSFAAIASGILLAQTLRRDEPWNIEGAQGILREIAPLAAWSTAGAAIYWTFSQGYLYLVAGTLDIGAVAAIAATRLLLMPVNLLSTGISSLMLPLAAAWLHRHGAQLVLRRLCLFASALAAVTLCYFAVVWWLRDWIFSDVLNKQFAQRDVLLLLWGAIVLVMVVRNQLGYLLAAQGRFHILTLLTLVSTVTSLVVGYLGMLRFGAAGALMGMLIGELINLVGVSAHSFRKPQHLLTAPA